MNMQPARLFTAISLPIELKNTISSWCEQHRPQLPFRNWTHVGDYHITLKFLGDTDSATAAKVREALSEVAVRSEPFSVRLSGIGHFGPQLAPAVLYAGLEGDTGKLAALQASIEDALESVSFAKEKRPFRAHITLARKYNGNTPFQAGSYDRLTSASMPLHWTVDDIVLYQSHLGRRPMYEAVSVFPFSKR